MRPRDPRSTPGRTGTVTNSILAQGSGQGSNCSTVGDGEGTVISGGGNVSTDASCGTSTVVLLASLALGALADNGGPTQTIALGAGSTAIGAGSGCIATDQRGVSRPTTGPCDAGAYQTSGIAGSATHLSVTGLTSTSAGTLQSATVTALDAYDNTATLYAGTVTLTSTDGQAVLGIRRHPHQRGRQLRGHAQDRWQPDGHRDRLGRHHHRYSDRHHQRRHRDPIAINAGNNESATVGTAVSTAPSVIVKDQYGNPVASVSVTFEIATGGGSLTGGSATTNTSGIATVGSWTLGTTAGSNTLTATSGSLTGSPVSFTATGTAGTVSVSTSTVVASPDLGDGGWQLPPPRSP